jgi:putative NIF3 family GTP cyclohydrolase 1 type 2
VAAALEDLLGPPAEIHATGGAGLRRLGLALAPDPGLGSWCAGARLDALVLHRSRGVEAPAGVAVVGCHDPFDSALGLAHNPWLHRLLGLSGVRPLAPKATVAGAPDDLATGVRRVFGGDEMHGRPAATGVAVLADAMSDALVRAAADVGAGLYVTGTWRPSAAAAVRETGLAVQVVGHARTERWALGLLGRLLTERLPGVEVLLRV